MKNTKSLKLIHTLIKGSRNRSSSSIYEALNIFASPSSKQPPSQFKPSILTSVAHGPVSEQFKEASKHERKLDKSEIDIGRLTNIIDLASASKETLEFNDKLLECSDREFRDIIKKITVETKLVSIVQFLYFHGKLTFSKMTAIMMNKNLVNLRLLPFDVQKIRQSDLGWDDIEYIKFDVSMLYKYYSLHQPLNIIKDLTAKFESVYLPAIESRKLPQFYERCLWRYFFQYSKDKSKDEQLYIRKLDDLYHSFTIWESTLLNNKNIASQILAYHGSSLNELQVLFLETCRQEEINEAINAELAAHKARFSETLGDLKKISMRHKLYSLGGDLQHTTVEQRAQLYGAIDALEKVVVRHSDTDALLVRLRQLKNDITKFHHQDGDVESWDDKLALLTSFVK